MHNFVVSRLSGGLGNQLFQYAAAYGIAAASGGAAAIDLSGYSPGGARRYMLDRYPLGVPIIHRSTFEDDFRHVIISDPVASHQGARTVLRLPVYRENNIEPVDIEVAKMASLGSLYLDGFWQSWKYFRAVAGDVHGRLAVTPSATPNNKVISRQIAQTQAVAVHVRRSDYLTASATEGFGTCDLDYYAAAIGLLRERVGDPKFFIFSDDPDWCCKQFRGADFVHVSMPTADPRDELALMRCCKHFILANSSFSWWGAWLGAGKDSTIVAPIPWFAQAPHAGDLLDDNWIRLNRRTGVPWSEERLSSYRQVVSVFVLTRGEESSLRAALDGVVAQTDCNVRVIVVLDASQPQREQAVSTIVGALPGAQWTLGNVATIGGVLATAARLAQGDWIAFLDEEDVWSSDKLRLQLDTGYLTGSDIVGCRTIPKPGRNGRPELFPPPGPPECSLEAMARRGKFIAGISHTIMRRRTLETLGPFDEWNEAIDSNGLWRRLTERDRTIVMWNRLVESATPFLA